MLKDEKYYDDVAKNSLSGGDVLAKGQFANSELIARFGAGKEKPEGFSKWLIENYQKNCVKLYPIKFLEI